MYMDFIPGDRRLSERESRFTSSTRVLHQWVGRYLYQIRGLRGISAFGGNNDRYRHCIGRSKSPLRSGVYKLWPTDAISTVWAEMGAFLEVWARDAVPNGRFSRSRQKLRLGGTAVSTIVEWNAGRVKLINIVPINEGWSTIPYPPNGSQRQE